MRVEALTFFRFFAAVIVVIFHFGQNTDLAKLSGPFIVSGPQMVTFFFVLSGFVLTISHQKGIESLRKYYISRAARIVPVYFLALAMMVYLSFGTGNNDIYALVLSLTFLQSWFTPYPLALNIAGWSLSVEMFFYLTFPLIIFIIRTSRISVTHFGVLCFIFYIFTQAMLSNLMTDKFYTGFPSASHDIIYYLPLSHYCSFLLGISGGYFYINQVASFHRKGPLPLMAMLLMLSLTYLSLQYPVFLVRFFGVPLAYGSSFYAILFLCTVLSIALSESFVTRLLSLRIFRILGESSFALYIFQIPAWNIYRYHLGVSDKLEINSVFYIYLFSLIVFSVVICYFVEKPARKLILKIDNFLFR